MTTATAETRTDIKRPSPLRALLWKEWRQQRMLFLALGFLPLILLMIPGSGNLQWILPASAGAAWCTLALLTAVTAFVGDEEDRSAEFLGALPVGRKKLFATKTAVILGLVSASMIIASPFYPKMMREYPAPAYLAHSIVAWHAVACLILVAVAAICAVFARSAVACVLAALVPTAAVAVWLGNVGVITQMSSVETDAYRSPKGFLETFGWVPLASSVLLFVLAGLIWSRRNRAGLARRFVIVGAATVLFLILAATPFVAQCVWFRYFSTSKAYSLNLPVPAPNGSHVAINCLEDHEGLRARVALVDTVTGQSMWIDRDHASSIDWNTNWSPDGRWLLMSVNEYPILTPAVGFLREWAQKRDKEELCVYDTKTGKLEKLVHLCPGIATYIPQRYNAASLTWVDSQTLFVVSVSGAAVCNLDSGSVSISQLSWGAYDGFLKRWITTSGLVFELWNAKGSMLARFDPQLKETHLIARHVSDVEYLDVAPDGRWALIAWRGKSSEYKYRIISLLDETTVQLADSTTPGEGILPPGTVPIRFVKSNLLVCRGSDSEGALQIGLLDVETRRFHSLAIKGIPPDVRPVGFNKLDPMKALFAKWGAGITIGSSQVPTAWVWSVDLETERATCVWEGGMIFVPHWLGKDRVLIQSAEGSLWVVNADGSGKKKLFPKD